MIDPIHKNGTRENSHVPSIRLTWFLTPHSPAGRFAHKSIAPHYCSSRLFRQDLHLRRTMLTSHSLAYVDRFACVWHRLSTTDSYAHIICNKKFFVYVYVTFLCTRLYAHLSILYRNHIFLLRINYIFLY